MADTFTVTVDLPAGMLERMRQRAKELQFHDVQFYIRWLVAKDIAPESPAANLVMALIHEGDSSGAIEVTEEYERELNERLDKLIASKASRAPERAAG